jgi:hypothetical protein
MIHEKNNGKCILVINYRKANNGQICGTRYLKYQSIYNTGSIPGKKQLFPEKKKQAQQICLVFL